MLRIFAAAIATLTMIASGVIHGYWTDRWGTPVDPADAAARFKSVPTTLGDWEEMNDAEAKPLKPDPLLAGSLLRHFLNRRTGQKVVILLVCGRFGPVSIHRPEDCYAANGYTMGSKTRLAAPGSSGEFWTADAIRTTASEEKKLRIYWAWNKGKGWTPADEARFSFAQTPVLHKLYVIRELNTLQENTKADPCLDFMQLLLPELDRTLFN